MSDKFSGEPAAWPSDVIVPLGYANIRVKILCIQYARIKEVLISKDGLPQDEAFWIPLSKIVILKDGEDIIATVPVEVAARLSREPSRPEPDQVPFDDVFGNMADRHKRKYRIG